MTSLDLTLKTQTETLEEGRRDDRPGRPRRAYSAPRLIEYGDVRDVVLGPTPGTGDSGNPFVFRA